MMHDANFDARYREADFARVDDIKGIDNAAKVVRNRSLAAAPHILPRVRGHDAREQDLEFHRPADTAKQQERDSALADSVREAVEAGYQQGLSEGRSLGEREGREIGFSAGEAEGRREGFARGVSEGRAEGAREAIESASRSVEARLNSLEQLLSMLQGATNEYVAAAEDDVVALVFEAVSQLLGMAFAHPDSVRDLVKQAVRQANTSRIIAIHTHPDDCNRLTTDEELAAWLCDRKVNGITPVRWVANAAVVMGGCLIQSADGSLDARLDMQMAALKQKLIRARQAWGSPDNVSERP